MESCKILLIKLEKINKILQILSKCFILQKYEICTVLHYIDSSQKSSIFLENQFRQHDHVNFYQFQTLPKRFTNLQTHNLIIKKNIIMEMPTILVLLFSTPLKKIIDVSFVAKARSYCLKIQ